MNSLEKLYIKMEGISIEELKDKQTYAAIIADILNNIDKKYIDLLHYIISIDDIKGYQYNYKDIYILKEYLLHLLNNKEYEQTADGFLTEVNLYEKLWLYMDINELKFTTSAVNILNDRIDRCKEFYRNIKRGLINYPFDRYYIYINNDNVK